MKGWGILQLVGYGACQIDKRLTQNERESVDESERRATTKRSRRTGVPGFLPKTQ